MIEAWRTLLYCDEDHEAKEHAWPRGPGYALQGGTSKGPHQATRRRIAGGTSD